MSECRKLPPGWSQRWLLPDLYEIRGPGPFDYFATGDEDYDAESAWKRWENHSGLSRAEYEAMGRDHRAMEALRGHAVVLLQATAHGWEVGSGTGAYCKVSGEPHYRCVSDPKDDPAEAILAALEVE